jgi:hypothetical protein
MMTTEKMQKKKKKRGRRAAAGERAIHTHTFPRIRRYKEIKNNNLTNMRLRNTEIEASDWITKDEDEDDLSEGKEGHLVGHCCVSVMCSCVLSRVLAQQLPVACSLRGVNSSPLSSSSSRGRTKRGVRHWDPLMFGHVCDSGFIRMRNGSGLLFQGRVAQMVWKVPVYARECWFGQWHFRDSLFHHSHWLPTKLEKGKAAPGS